MQQKNGKKTDDLLFHERISGRKVVISIKLSLYLLVTHECEFSLHRFFVWPPLDVSGIGSHWLTPCFLLSESYRVLCFKIFFE